MKVFISYRRSDSQHIAGRLAERLNNLPGIQKVFIDVDGINPGTNFITKIDQALVESDICLVIIGNDWVGMNSDMGTVRILNEDDFVRRETAAALASGNKVIPVFIDDAPLPSASNLPQDLYPILTIDGVFLRHRSFNQDMDLVEDAVFSRKARTPMARFFRRHPFLTLLLKAMLGVLIAVIALVGLAMIHFLMTDGRPLEQTIGNQGLVWLIILAIITLGAIVPIWFSIRR